MPSGAVAGIFARTDAQRGVWKAPANGEPTTLGVRADEWKDILIGAIAIFMEETVCRGLEWVVFEPNDEAALRADPL